MEFRNPDGSRTLGAEPGSPLADQLISNGWIRTDNLDDAVPVTDLSTAEHTADQLALVQNENGALRAELGKVQIELRVATDRNATLRSEKGRTSGDVEPLLARITELEADLDAAEHGGAAGDLEDALADVASLTAEVTELRDAHTDTAPLLARITELEADLKELADGDDSDVVSGLQAENADLRKQIEELTTPAPPAEDEDPPADRPAPAATTKRTATPRTKKSGDS